MAEENDAQEKSFEPTAKRRSDARSKGQIPRSRELGTTTLLMFSIGAVIATTPFIMGCIEGIFRGALAPADQALLFEPVLLPGFFMELVFQGLIAVAPVLAVSAVAAVLGTLAVGGWGFSVEAFGFQLDRIDPVKGLGRVFSARGLLELVKALVKFTLVLGVACLVMWMEAPDILALGRSSVNSALASCAVLIAKGAMICASVTILIALVDAPFQVWDNTRKLRMSREQIKEENKDTEGRPEVKARIRGIQQEMARQRMMQEVPNADVIITNPTHFAVALQYRAGTMAAPIVLARGADNVAARIREVGTASKVLIVSSPLLARALYFTTRPGDPIPVELYQAVAQILAWVFGLKAGQRAPSELPRQLPIPEEFMFDERGRRAADDGESSS